MAAIGHVPLADQLRPTRLEEVVGQEHLTDADGPLGRMAETGRLSSMILWGPPGCGKTSIARLLANAFDVRFSSLSAVFSGVADLKRAFAAAEEAKSFGEQTLLFVDEIHRFNRSQQDAFLPVVEDGTIILIGATTENPSFEINAALLSRAQLLVLRRLDEAALERLLAKAEAHVGQTLPIDENARTTLIASSDGDGRFLLNQAEMLWNLCDDILDRDAMLRLLQRRAPVYDKDRDGHYNLISALHKAMRGSDPDAALYYLARMLTAGEDPLYVLRRITRFASEDVGLADPQALTQCMAALDAYRFLGSPEGELAIVQACLYCATAPKSNAVYGAQKAAWALAKQTGSLPPPVHVVNAPTKAMKDLGMGVGYVYDHDAPDGFSGQNFWPDRIEPHKLYHPVERGHEKRIAERLAWWAQRRVAQGR
ncbi:replication-associated recombination protein A [Sphingomonas lacunae]|uniref:Replication-associated recombination protein A n=1 Tax=Sphingomonas lacunae TaxID=2698828 RepID=A0A6M4B084_9SPHN|nr:replication-associated recombination protein A [Sphingomonas lacunae]QJQ32741.1 replication-associated recombination protein A [Sphingomonas lacunae]